MRDHIAHCTTCEQRVPVEWSGGTWRYAEHRREKAVGVAVRNGNAVGIAVKDVACPASNNALPPGVFTVAVPFDPEYDDPEGAGWIISDEYFG